MSAASIPAAAAGRILDRRRSSGKCGRRLAPGRKQACPLGQQRPGGLAPRHEVPELVVHLERRPRCPAGVVRPGREPGKRPSQRPEHACHQPERGADECGELLVGLVGMGEEPVERLQQRLVAQVEHLRYRAGQRIADQGLRLGDVIRLAGERRDDRAGRLERRVRLGELAVLLPDAEEPAVVGGLPVAPGALALLDDLADGGHRRLQVMDRDELRPAEQFRMSPGPAAARRTPHARRSARRKP